MAVLSLQDIVNVGFHKSNIGGYKAEEVDAFIDSVQQTFEQKKLETDDLKKKLAILAKKVEQYRTEEESIKSTLLNAQKLADASVREAKHKSEVIISDAEARAYTIVGDIEGRYNDEVEALKNMKQEVVNFRSKMLEMYKEHLRLIDALPREEELGLKTDKSSKEETYKDLEVKLDEKNELDKSQKIDIKSFEHLVIDDNSKNSEFSVETENNTSDDKQSAQTTV